MNRTGSAMVQGQLWGRAAPDWAELLEPTALPLWDAMLDAAAVGPGTHVLDAGCGAGGASVLAVGRDAYVNGLDAAESLLTIARRRVPVGDFHLGDLEALPCADAAFEAILVAEFKDTRRITMASDRDRTAVLGAALALSAALMAVVALATTRPDVAAARAVAVGAFPLAVVLEPRTGRAFVANDGDGSVSILDLSGPRPQVRRTVHLGAATAVAFAPLALALDAGTHHLFVAGGTAGGAASAVYMLDSRSGARRATARVGQEVSAVAVDERRGHVFVTAEGDGSVSLLDARSGAALCTARVGLAPVALAVDARTARAFVLGTVLLPAEQPDSGHAGRVGVLDTRTGALVRSVAVGYGPAALALDARTARAFVANSGDDTVSVLDAHTGVVLRTVAVGWTPAALAVDERHGRVFVMNEDDGTVSVLDARTGRRQSTFAVFGGATASAVIWPYALAVDEARTRVYVTVRGQLDQAGLPTESGQLAVLDARSGRLLRTIEVGVAPRAVAVEAGSGRVVVVNSGGTVRAPQGWLERWKRHVVGWAPWLGQILPREPDVSVMPGSVQVIDPPPGRES